MILGFDAKRALSNFTGLGNYSRLVIESLAHALPDSQLNLYAPKNKVPKSFSEVVELPNVTLHTPQEKLWKYLPSVWRVSNGLTKQLEEDKIELYHGLSNELPLDIQRAPCASVVTIHDLIFRHFKEGYHKIDRSIYDFKFKRAAKVATRIIAVSEATRRDIIESYNIDPSKIDVVYQGCSSMFRRPKTEAEIDRVRKKYGINGRYIVSVGTVEPRKNQLLLLKALRALPQDVKAVIVGRHRGDYGMAVKGFARLNRLMNRVIFIENAPFEDLPALYAGAEIASYTSRMEGFGIPVIEAINCGTPVVACTGTCLQEAGGPGAIYVNPDDAEEAAHAYKRLLDDPLLCVEMVAAGMSYVDRFTPDRFTAGLLSTYHKALEEKR